MKKTTIILLFLSSFCFGQDRYGTEKILVKWHGKTVQSLPTNVNAVLTNWAESLDNTNIANPVTGQITIAVTGWYSYNLRHDIVLTGVELSGESEWLGLLRNNIAIDYKLKQYSTATVGIVSNIEANNKLVFLTAGDIVSPFAKHNHLLSKNDTNFIETNNFTLIFINK
jgi:hypothetical protein